jgi:hypothetical protein
VFREYAESIQAPMEYVESISAYSENTRNVFIHGADGEFGVVCGIQNRLQVHREYLNVLGEDAESIQA